MKHVKNYLFQIPVTVNPVALRFLFDNGYLGSVQHEINQRADFFSVRLKLQSELYILKWKEPLA
jgi:hypothetical protein